MLLLSRLELGDDVAVRRVRLLDLAPRRVRLDHEALSRNRTHRLDVRLRLERAATSRCACVTPHVNKHGCAYQPLMPM